MKEKSVIPVLVLVFVILATGIVAAGCLFYRSQQDSVKTQAEHKLAAIADLKASGISRWRKENLADAGVLYRNLAFSDLVRHYIEQPRDSAKQEELRSWLGHIQTNHHYDRIALFDAAGKMRMLVSDTDEPLSSATIQKAREVLRSGKLTFDDLYRNEHSRKIYLRLFVPILDGRDVEHPIGVVVLRIDPNAHLYPFVQRWPTPSKTAETLLLRREGNEVVFLSELKFRENTALALRLPLDGKSAPAVKAALGQEGIIEGIDCYGVPVLAAVRTVPDSPWFLVAKIDIAEVYAPMRERFWLMALLMGAFLFGAAAILGLIWRRQQLGLYREKYDAERRYRAILEISADGIMIADVETRRFRYANLAACRMLGYTKEELTTMSVADIIPKDALQDVLAEFDSQACREKSLATNISCLRKDGTIVYADINSARDALDGRAHVVGMFRDVSERRKAEQIQGQRTAILEQLASDTSLSEILNAIVLALEEEHPSSVCSILLVDESGRRLLHGAAPGLPDFYNQAINGLEIGDGIGSCGTAAATGERVVAEDIRTHPYWIPFRELAKNAGVASCWSEPILTQDGRVLGTFAIYHRQPCVPDENDWWLIRYALANARLAIEHKQAEAELHRARHAAEAANRAKSAFLANMSHEIRTPMTSILGYSELIAESLDCCTVCPSYSKCGIRAANGQHLQAVRRNAEHLLELIGGILDLSKIEAGKLQIEPTRCSPVQLVAEVVSLMRTQAAAKKLRLKTKLAGPLPETVLTDPLRLRQMLVNLVSNAIKFADQGEVRLTVRLIADNGPPRLRFDVTDTGIGMNEEQIGKLFQPFCQVDSSSTRKFGGTGLGLALSKHLAEALGGSIEVRSTPGKGSTFSVAIDPGPLDGIRMIRGARKAVVQPRPTAASAADKTTLHGRILLAEDGLDNQRLIVLFLKKAGAKVTTVENGQIAVEAALAAREAGKPFDVILMDMQMPVMDGYEATRQLRSMDYRGPIVALTASAMGPDQQKCLEAGCDDYLSKPFEQHDLLQIAAKHTQASAPDGQRDSVVFDSAEQAGSCPGAFGQQP